MLMSSTQAKYIYFYQHMQGAAGVQQAMAYSNGEQARRSSFALLEVRAAPLSFPKST
jgi:hypothetical protein